MGRKPGKRAREAQDITRFHTEYLAYVTWEEFKEILRDEAGVDEGHQLFDKCRSIWESWQQHPLRDAPNMTAGGAPSHPPETDPGLPG